MNDCQFQSAISAYHDGELNPELSRLVEQHLNNCAACCTLLADLRAISGGITDEISIAVAPLTHRATLVRLGDAVLRATQRDREARDLGRTTLVLAALAASVLIVSSIWLVELRPAADADLLAWSGSSSAEADDSTVSPGSDWERIAVTLRADPRPAIAGDSPFAPRYADAIDWMLHNLAPILSRSEGPPWEKRS